jgi:hypothetical protein
LKKVTKVLTSYEWTGALGFQTGADATVPRTSAIGGEPPIHLASSAAQVIDAEDIRIGEKFPDTSCDGAPNKPTD